MVTMLRITVFIFVILLVSSGAFGKVSVSASDAEIEEFLNAPSIIEIFRKANGAKSKSSSDEISPLVKEARAFALYLDPPAPPITRPATKPGQKRAGRTVIAPPKIKAKFELVATSYYPLRPELSLALINEPGKGYHWVRQSGTLGYLTIEEIKDGVVVVNDGTNSSQLAVERVGKRSLIRGESTGLDKTKSLEKLPSSIMVPTDALAGQPAGLPAEQPYLPALNVPEGMQPPGMSEEEMALMEKHMQAMQAMQAEVGPDGDWGSKTEEMEAMNEKHMSEMDALRVGKKEATKLNRLGKELDGPDADQIKKRGSKVRPKTLSSPTRRKKK